MQIKENIKAPRHWPLCREFTGTGEFPAQMASNAENVSIWWRHHESTIRSYPAYSARRCVLMSPPYKTGLKKLPMSPPYKAELKLPFVYLNGTYIVQLLYQWYFDLGRSYHVVLSGGKSTKSYVSWCLVTNVCLVWSLHENTAPFMEIQHMAINVTKSE